MTTNLNGTFAAVQAASRELALLSDIFFIIIIY